MILLLSLLSFAAKTLVEMEDLKAYRVMGGMEEVYVNRLGKVYVE